MRSFQIVEIRIGDGIMMDWRCISSRQPAYTPSSVARGAHSFIVIRQWAATPVEDGEFCWCYNLITLSECLRPLEHLFTIYDFDQCWVAHVAMAVLMPRRMDVHRSSNPDTHLLLYPLTRYYYCLPLWYTIILLRGGANGAGPASRSVNIAFEAGLGLYCELC